MVSSNYFGQNGDNGRDISDARGNISLSGKINAPDSAFVQAQNGDINLSDKAVVANNQTTYKSAEIRSKRLDLTTFHGDIKNSVHEGNDTYHQLVDNFEHNDITNYFVNAHDGEVNLSKTNIDSGNAMLEVTATKGIALKNVTTNSGRIEINNSIDRGEYTNEVSGNITVTGNLSTNLKNNDTNNQLVQGVGLIQVSNGAANPYITEGEYMPQRDLNINLTNVSATNVNIKAYGDVKVANITGSENTNQYVQNDIHIKAANNLNVAGTIKTFNGNVTIEAGNVATINSVKANGELKVDADSIDKINAEAQRIKIFTNKGANIGTLKSKTDSNDGNIGPIFVQNRSKADLNPAFENLTTALDKYKEFMERAIAMVDKLIELHLEDDSLPGIKGDLESQLIYFDQFRRNGDEGAKISVLQDYNGYSNFESKYESIVKKAENVHSQYQSLLENSNYQSDLSNEDVASLMTAARTAYSDATARWEVAKVSDVTLPTIAPTGDITLAGEIDARNAGTETKKGYVTVENFGGNIILGTSETPAIIKGAAVTLTAKAIEDVVDGPTSSITTTEKSVKAGMEYEQNPTFFTATNGNITLTNTELTLRSGLIAEANGSVTLSRLQSEENVNDPNVVIVKANSGITTNSFSATGENEVSLENTKVDYDYEQALNDVKAIYTLIKDDTNIDSNIRDAIKERIQFAEKYLNEGNVEEVRWNLSDAIEQCNNNAVTGAVSLSIDVPANMEVYATKPSGAITVGDVKNTLNSNSGDIYITNDGGKISVNGNVSGNSVNLSSVGQIELNNSEMQVGNITMTAKGIEDVANTTNSIKANNSGDSMYPVMTLTAVDGDIALNNTKLNASNGKMLVKAEKGSVTIEDEVKARELELTSAKGVTLGDVTTYSGLMQVTNSNAIKVFDYALCYDDINSVWNSIEGRINYLNNNILPLVSGQDIATKISGIITNLNTALNNIKTKAQAHEDVSQDWANARDYLSYLSIKIPQLNSVLSQMVDEYVDNGNYDAADQCANANVLLMNDDGINTFINGLKNNTITEAKLESYNVTQPFNEAVTLKGAINAHTSDENHLGSVTISNNGGDVVLNNATINAGTVTMTANGIEDAENTTNSITANNQQGESLFLTAYNGDIDLSNTTLKASDCTLSASSFAGAVKIANDMEVGNVNVYAHSGIEVGNISAIKQYGIHMENTLATWDKTSVNNAIQYLETVVTDGIKNADSSGYLEQYMERAKEYSDKGDFQMAGYEGLQGAFETLMYIYSTHSNAFSEKPAGYEQFMAHATGDIKAGKLTAQNTILTAKSVDVGNIVGNTASINADNIKANSINLTADLSIGEMAPVGTAEIGSIEAASVNINTNQGATYGNITTTGGEQSEINLSNVNKYDFEKINESYTAILNSLSRDDRDTVEDEFTYSLESAIESRNGELALEELAGAYQMATTDYEADLSGISVDPEEYITEAQNDITLKGALSANGTTWTYDETLGHDVEVPVEGVGNVNIENLGGNIVLGSEGKNATINAGKVTMTAKGIEDAENTTNSIKANGEGDTALSLTATSRYDIDLSNTTLNAPKGGLFATAENASVKITKDMEADSVEISAHSGIEVGDITATGDNGITLSNTLSVENQQTPEEATGDITAGILKAQYVEDDETYGGSIQITNKSDQSQTTTEDERNIFLSDVTGGEITIEGDNLISTGKIEGEHISVYSYKADFNELEGNRFDFGVGELNANSIKAKSEYGLNVGYYKQPVFKADIGSIEATSVNINTNEGVTIGNITITENSDEGSDLQNKISINNVSVYDFEKCNDNYNAILKVLSLDDAEAVSSEYGSSFNSAVISGNIEEALEALDGALQMAKGKGATLTGISVDSADYIIKEAENDITIKGAFQLDENNESGTGFDVELMNAGGDILLDGTNIDAGTVAMTAENIIEAEDSVNSISANNNKPEGSDLSITATDGFVRFDNTTLTAEKGEVEINAISAGQMVLISDDIKADKLTINADSLARVGLVTGNEVSITSDDIVIEDKLTANSVNLKAEGFIVANDIEVTNSSLTLGTEEKLVGSVFVKKAKADGIEVNAKQNAVIGDVIDRGDKGIVINNLGVVDTEYEDSDDDTSNNVLLFGKMSTEGDIRVHNEGGDIALGAEIEDSSELEEEGNLNAELNGNKVILTAKSVVDAYGTENSITANFQPEGDYATLDSNGITIKTTDGNVMLTNTTLNSNKDIDIVAEEGNVVAGQVEAENISIIADNNIEIDSISGVEVDLTAKGELSAESLEAGSVNITTKAGAHIGDINSTGSGEGYEVEINNTESGNIEIGNVNAEGEAKINNDAAEGNVKVGNVKGANVYVRTLNELASGDIEATSSSNNTLESPERGALYLEGANLNYASAKSAGNSMEIDSTHAEVVIDGVVTKIYMGEPIIEEGVDIYTFRSDITDIPETMKESLEILKATGKIIPLRGTNTDVAEIARTMLRDQNDKGEAQDQTQQTEPEQEIDLNLNANLDLGGDIEGLDVEADDTTEERLQIAMNEDGKFELISNEDNANVVSEAGNVSVEDDNANLASGEDNANAGSEAGNASEDNANLANNEDNANVGTEAENADEKNANNVQSEDDEEEKKKEGTSNKNPRRFTLVPRGIAAPRQNAGNNAYNMQYTGRTTSVLPRVDTRRR